MLGDYVKGLRLFATLSLTKSEVTTAEVKSEKREVKQKLGGKLGLNSDNVAASSLSLTMTQELQD